MFRKHYTVPFPRMNVWILHTFIDWWNCLQ